MKPRMIISVSSPEEFSAAQGSDPDLIELRIDLMDERDFGTFEEYILNCSIPLIGTIRSGSEGGRFRGSPEEWLESIRRWTPVCEFIDLERGFFQFSPVIRAAGKKVIASVHLDYMPGHDELLSLEEELRGTGDVVKIIVAPGNRGELLDLCRFTLKCRQPVITGIMGEEYRWARALCCIFGSSAVFCHAGSPASPGQYHIEEMRQLLSLLR